MSCFAPFFIFKSLYRHLKMTIHFMKNKLFHFQKVSRFKNAFSRTPQIVQFSLIHLKRSKYLTSK